jgi:hypothetical protein
MSFEFTPKHPYEFVASAIKRFGLRQSSFYLPIRAVVELVFDVRTLRTKAA